MHLDLLQIECRRSVWRSIPSKVKATDSEIFSRVQTHKNGRIAAIFFRNGMFEAECAGMSPAIRVFTHAEDFAIATLEESRRSACEVANRG